MCINERKKNILSNMTKRFILIALAADLLVHKSIKLDLVYSITSYSVAHQANQPIQNCSLVQATRSIYNSSDRFIVPFH